MNVDVATTTSKIYGVVAFIGVFERDACQADPADCGTGGFNKLPTLAKVALYNSTEALDSELGGIGTLFDGADFSSSARRMQFFSQIVSAGTSFIETTVEVVVETYEDVVEFVEEVVDAVVDCVSDVGGCV